LDIVVDFPSETRPVLVPSFILQPLSENAIRHGIMPGGARGQVQVRSRRGNGLLRIDIIDNGAGVAKSSDVMIEKGHGLRKTRNRLRHLYGDEATMTIPNGGSEGAHLTLVLPLRVRGPDGPAESARG